MPPMYNPKHVVNTFRGENQYITIALLLIHSMMNRITKINMFAVLAVAGLVLFLGNAPRVEAAERNCSVEEVKALRTQGKINISNGSDNASWVIENNTDCWFQIYMWSGRLIGNEQLEFAYARDIVHSFVTKTFSIPVPKDCGYQFDLGYGIFQPRAKANGFIDLDHWNTVDWGFAGEKNGLAGGLIGTACAMPTPTPSATPTATPKPEEKKAIDVEKTDNRDITRPGHSLTYVITVKNNGNVDISDGKVTDTVPGQLTVTSIGNGGRQSGSVITWSDIKVGAGETKEFTFKATVKSNTANGHVLDNKVKARSEDQDIQDEANDRTVVQRQPEVLAAAVALAPVPITAKTGTGALPAIVSTLMGAAGLVVTLRKGS